VASWWHLRVTLWDLSLKARFVRIPEPVELFFSPKWSVNEVLPRVAPVET
jgi:hypothetical protein